MPPVNPHLQCGINLYSNVKNVTRIRNWDKGHGIDVVLFLLLIFYYYYYYNNYYYYYYGLKLSFTIFLLFSLSVCVIIEGVPFQWFANCVVHFLLPKRKSPQTFALCSVFEPF